MNSVQVVQLTTKRKVDYCSTVTAVNTSTLSSRPPVQDKLRMNHTACRQCKVGCVAALALARTALEHLGLDLHPDASTPRYGSLGLFQFSSFSFLLSVVSPAF